MTDRPIAFDLTRLVTRLRHASPSGIDRVDLAYARAFLGRPEPGFGVVSTKLGPRVLDRDRALAIVEAVAAGWVEDRDAPSDPVYRRFRQPRRGRLPPVRRPGPPRGAGSRRGRQPTS
jgi:hypothetical protein